MAVLAWACVCAHANAANLLRNGSFEATPCATPCGLTQAIVPADWVALTPGLLAPDTYSNDGSFGLSPQDYGNFTGVTAQDGIRWIAGWSAYSETFGQVLSAPLIPGHQYVLTGYLRQAVRADLAFPGSYRVELWSDTTGTTKVALGSFAPTSGPVAWESRTLSFTAPVDAAGYTVIAFVAIKAARTDAYVGIDNLVLSDSSDGADGGSCSSPDLSDRLVIDGCETGVTNRYVGNGCTLVDSVRSCLGLSTNHGNYVSCIAVLTNSLQRANLLSGLERGQIQRCAAQARVP
jgi:hypothetical protein